MERSQVCIGVPPSSSSSPRVNSVHPAVDRIPGNNRTPVVSSCSRRLGIRPNLRTERRCGAVTLLLWPGPRMSRRCYIGVLESIYEWITMCHCRLVRQCDSNLTDLSRSGLALGLQEAPPVFLPLGVLLFHILRHYILMGDIGPPTDLSDQQRKRALSQLQRWNMIAAQNKIPARRTVRSITAGLATIVLLVASSLVFLSAAPAPAEQQGAVVPATAAPGQQQSATPPVATAPDQQQNSKLVPKCDGLGTPQPHKSHTRQFGSEGGYHHGKWETRNQRIARQSHEKWGTPPGWKYPGWPDQKAMQRHMFKALSGY